MIAGFILARFIVLIMPITGVIKELALTEFPMKYIKVKFLEG